MKTAHRLTKLLGRSLWLLVAMVMVIGLATPSQAADKPTTALTKHDIEITRALAKLNSEVAMEQELNAIDEFVAERKKGSRQFAEVVLSNDTKLKLVGYRTLDMFDILGAVANRLMGGDAEPTEQGEKDLNAYVAKQFRQHVLNETDLQATITKVYDGYISRLKVIDNRMLIQLKVDVEDKAIQHLRIKPSNAASAAIAATAKGTVGQIGDDLGVDIIRGSFSWLVSDLVGRRITGKNDSFFMKAGKDAVIGMATDTVIDKGMARNGYDPISAVAAKVNAELDKLRDVLVEGDERVAAEHKAFKDQSELHYADDAAVKAACNQARRAIEQSGRLGLRWQLKQLCVQRDRARGAMTQAMWNAAKDDDKPDSREPENTIGVFEPRPRKIERERLLRYCREYIRHYGGGSQ